MASKNRKPVSKKKLIVGETVISKPGASVLVKQLHLTPEAQAALSTGGVQIPPLKKHTFMESLAKLSWSDRILSFLFLLIVFGPPVLLVIGIITKSIRGENLW